MIRTYALIPLLAAAMATGALASPTGERQGASAVLVSPQSAEGKVILAKIARIDKRLELLGVRAHGLDRYGASWAVDDVAYANRSFPTEGTSTSMTTARVSHSPFTHRSSGRRGSSLAASLKQEREVLVRRLAPGADTTAARGR